MKDVLKCVGLLLVGLFVAVIAYPFLHEAGHSLTAFLVGAKAIKLVFFPLPFTACEVAGVNSVGLVAIGLGGMLFPMLLSVMVHPKSFWLWYGMLLIKGICLLSFLISAISMILYFNGIEIVNEDIIQVLKVWDGGSLVLAMILALAIIITIHSTIRQKPFNRILAYFEVPTKKANAV